MFVYIAHAEADQAAADDLKAFLKTRGLVAETETGARGFRHLQKSDVVIGLWSQKAVFSAHRMQMENRLLDAWADEKLVLVKLDHGMLPVGLRDLSAIDASFETGRQLSVWPQVERAAKDAMNRALAAAREELAASLGDGRVYQGEAPAKPLPPRETMGVGSGGPPPAASAPPQTRTPFPPPVTRPIEVSDEDVAAPRAKGSGLGRSLLFLICLAVWGGSAWLVLRPDVSFPAPTAALGIEGLGDLEITNLQAAGLGAAIGVLLMLMVFGGRGRAEKKAGPALRPAAAAAAAAPGAPQPASAVFISYAHADNAAVEPVVDVVKRSGREVWIDKGGIQAGEGWAGEIVRGIKAARGVMVMCSPRAFESDHIKREVYLADRYKKPMLPVFIAEAQPPEDFEYFFASVQWLELFKLPEAERPAAIGKALGAV